MSDDPGWQSPGTRSRTPRRSSPARSPDVFDLDHALRSGVIHRPRTRRHLRPATSRSCASACWPAAGRRPSAGSRAPRRTSPLSSSSDFFDGAGLEVAPCHRAWDHVLRNQARSRLARNIVSQRSQSCIRRELASRNPNATDQTFTDNAALPCGKGFRCAPVGSSFHSPPPVVVETTAIAIERTWTGWNASRCGHVSAAGRDRQL